MDNCSILDVNEFYKIGRVRGGMSLTVGILSLLLILFVLLKLCWHQCKQVRVQTGNCCSAPCLHTFFCNPFLWLAVSSTVTSFAFSLNLGSINENSYCLNSGFLIQVTESFENWTTLFFAIYFVVYMICKGKPLTDDHADEQAGSSTLCYCGHAATVFVFGLIFFIICLVYNSPAVVESNGGSYGNSGPWCWIEGTNAQWRFWYGFFWLFRVIGFFCFVVALLILYCGCNCYDEIHWKKKPMLCLILALLIFYFTHIILGIIESVVRLDQRNDCSENTKNLWYTYATLTPLSKIFLVGAALVLVTVQFVSPKHLVERSQNFQPLNA